MVDNTRVGTSTRSDKNSGALILLGIEHKRFHQVLDLLERQLERGAGADRELIDRVIDYFLDFPDTCHHPKEDLLYARLEARMAGRSAECGDLAGEHEELSEITHRTRAALDATPADAPLPDATRADLRDFLRVYRAHIEAENSDFFPAVMRHLTQDDLDLIDFDLFDREDPVYDGATEGRFARLRREIMARGEGIDDT